MANGITKRETTRDYVSPDRSTHPSHSIFPKTKSEPEFYKISKSNY